MTRVAFFLFRNGGRGAIQGIGVTAQATFIVRSSSICTRESSPIPWSAAVRRSSWRARWASKAHGFDLHSGSTYKAAHSGGRGQAVGCGAFASALSQHHCLERQGVGQGNHSKRWNTEDTRGGCLVFADETSMRAVRGEKHGDGTGLDELMSMDSRVPG